MEGKWEEFADSWKALAENELRDAAQYVCRH